LTNDNEQNEGKRQTQPMHAAVSSSARPVPRSDSQQHVAADTCAQKNDDVDEGRSRRCCWRPRLWLALFVTSVPSLAVQITKIAMVYSFLTHWLACAWFLVRMPTFGRVCLR
jgi:hypothetical protein